MTTGCTIENKSMADFFKGTQYLRRFTGVKEEAQKQLQTRRHLASSKKLDTHSNDQLERMRKLAGVSSSKCDDGPDMSMVWSDMLMNGTVLDSPKKTLELIPTKDAYANYLNMDEKFGQKTYTVQKILYNLMHSFFSLFHRTI